MLFNQWKQVEEYYQSSTINPSENTLLQHFGGSPLYKDAAHLNSIDIDYLNRRASQNTIDIWHLSGKSQSDFTHSSLINFESHSKSIYSSFVGYLAQFTRLFYSSLQLYLSNEPDLLLGDVNGLIQMVLQTVQQLQQQPVPPRGNIHVDLELKYKYNTKASHEANLNAADDFDVDPKFKYPTPKPVKSQMAKPEIHRAEEVKEGKMQRGPKGKSYDLEKEGGMKRILRELLMSISKSYHHYSLELNGNNLKAYELQTSIPRCSVEYSPLCKLFNTISRMKDRKCAEDEASITISFHRYFDHLCLYLLVRGVDGKVYGQRIFLNELTTVLVGLFKDQVISKETLSALDEVQLKEDKDFTKFADFLKEKEVNEIDLVLADNNDIFAQLNEFIFDYNQYRDIAHQIDGYAVTRCFRDNIMDYTDFADLNSNLKRYGIRAGPVRKLWRFLNPVGMVEDVDEQRAEGVVLIPPGTYMYIPLEYEEILFDNNHGEYIHFEIGESLSVPSDWSNDDE